MLTATDFQGVYTAIVTPFTADGTAVDYEALDKLVERQIAEGVTGVVPCGTTGENPTLNKEETQGVISAVIKKAAGRIQVIAGTGSNNTQVAVAQTQWAKEAGADACLVVNPYYNKPGQEGLYQHFKAVAAVGVPIMLYNIPGRTGITMTSETVARLRKDFPNIVAYKGATGSVDDITEICGMCDISCLSGDDGLTLPMIAVGAKGVVSVLSNFDAAAMVALVKPALANDFDTARKHHLRLAPMMKMMFIEANPQPVKAAMAEAGMCTDKCRQPLWEMDPANREKLMTLLKSNGYFSGEPAAKKAKN